MLGVGDERKEDEQSEGVDPPEGFDRCARVGEEEGGEVGGHQREDEQSDEAGFVGDLLAEPDGANKKTADEEAGDRDSHKQRPRGREREVEAADEACRRQEGEAQAGGEVVERDQGEGEESPEDEGVGDAGKGTLADDFGLAEDFAGERPDAAGDGAEGESEVLAGGEDGAQDGAEAKEKEGCGGDGEQEKEGDFDG